eukprot:350180-Chlamydomonas_euryale.AAC.1
MNVAESLCTQHTTFCTFCSVSNVHARAGDSWQQLHVAAIVPCGSIVWTPRVWPEREGGASVKGVAAQDLKDHQINHSTSGVAPHSTAVKKSRRPNRWQRSVTPDQKCAYTCTSATPTLLNAVAARVRVPDTKAPTLAL